MRPRTGLCSCARLCATPEGQGGGCRRERGDTRKPCNAKTGVATRFFHALGAPWKRRLWPVKLEVDEENRVRAIVAEYGAIE